MQYQVKSISLLSKILHLRKFSFCVGIEAWNKAFESWLKNAKVQPDDAEWDAGDVRYNVGMGFNSDPYSVWTVANPEQEKL